MDAVDITGWLLVATAAVVGTTLIITAKKK